MGADYVFDGSSTHTLNYSITSFSVQVLPVDDEVFELTESLSTNLSFSRSAPPGVSIDTASVDIEILDNGNQRIIFTGPPPK